MNAAMRGGTVYVLTNPAMKGIVKIGKTTREVNSRLSELYKTGVPMPFICEYSAHVENEDKAEKALFEAFAPYRINSNREFFQVEANQVIALLKYMELKENIETKIESPKPVFRQINKSTKIKKQFRLRFRDIGIPSQSQLLFQDGETTCTAWDHGCKAVVKLTSSNKEYSKDWRNGGYSLYELTRKLLGKNSPIKPFRYWSYKEKTLEELINDSSLNFA